MFYLQILSIQNYVLGGVIYMPKVKDLKGQIIGCNQVLHRIPTPRGTNAWWRVKCIHCGREKDEMGSRLKLKGYNSCSCQPREIRGNKYKIDENDIVTMFDCNNREFIFDLADLEVVSKHTWQVYTTTNGKDYVRCATLKTPLHRFLLKPQKDYVVDHINGDTLDNRRSNLRVCTHTQNMFNQKLRSNNTTGVKGVTRCGNKYRATIRVNRKDIHLGMYNTLEEAKEKRIEAEKKYFGEFRYEQM